ncbi:acyltransferase domain-containing protein, partial [Amycolatopsis cihanbeyliensis]
LAAALAHAADDAPARAAVPARDLGLLRERLRLLAEGQPHWSAHTATPAAGHDPVFVFSGYGSQWPGMARRLLAEEPAFAEAVTELDGVFREVAGVELSVLLAAEQDAEAGPLSGWQLALFGMQVALARLWRAYGVRPAAVLGHSMGEVAAAVVVGALEPAEGLRVMVHRTAVLDELQAEGAGAMAVVELAPDELDELAESFAEVTVAVYASPTQCTVSGPTEQVAALVEHVAAGGGLARIVPTGVAGHSAAVDPLLDRFTAALAGLRATPEAIPPGIAWYSGVLEEPRLWPAFDAGYWAANLRKPVRFTQALAAAMADGHRLFVEISPHPVTAVAVEQTAGDLGSDLADLTMIPTLRRDPDDGGDGFAAALAAMCAQGRIEVLRGRYPEREVIDLPPPVWEHREYWAEAGSARSPGRTGHPFLGERVEVPGTDQQVWPAEVGLAAHPWLAEHTAHGVPVLPAAALAELMLAAAADALPAEPATDDVELREVVLHRILPLAERTQVSVSAVPARGGDIELSVSARSGGEWERYASATATAGGTPTAAVAGEVLVEVEHPAGPARSGFTLHPALGAACVRALVSLAGDPGDPVWLATRIGRVRVTGDPRRAATVSGSLDSSTGSVRLLDPDGAVLAELAGVTLAATARADIPFVPERLAYQAEWVPSELPADAASSTASISDWVVLHADSVDPAALVGLLTERGHRAVAVPMSRRGEPGAITGPAAAGGVVVLVDNPDSPAELDAARALTLAVAGVVRELAGSAGTPPRLWLVTRGARAVRPDEAGHPGPTALRGLVRVLAYEHPELRATLIDLDGSDRAAERTAVRELLADRPEDEVAWRDGRRFAYTVARDGLAVEQRPAPVVRDGAYLITGGLGGLGIAAARWLAGAGATRIVLS